MTDEKQSICPPLPPILFACSGVFSPTLYYCQLKTVSSFPGIKTIIFLQLECLPYLEVIYI